MNPDSILPPGRAGSPRTARRERIAVLGPLGLATAAACFGRDGDLLAPVWLAAVAWTVFASFALALHAGLRRGDWSAFRDYRHEPDREEEMDLDLRTGGYAFMRDRDLRGFGDHADSLH
ncbi:MAG: hypothetical protein F4114_05355 [Rhodospirillaceae bacterium]|nr:hypothetical protein [Rhodospirillaceae bacterium]MYB12864.1 hypothetical protein [Rhodospirillaceae bacterium]MYI48499.1 hypothetical protein [Rhodospirillaceae bacterium]